MAKKAKPKGDPIDVIVAHMEANGLGPSDLAAIIGRSACSLMLNRRRPLSLDAIRAIHAAWQIDANLLIRDYPLVNPAK